MASRRGVWRKLGIWTSGGGTVPDEDMGMGL